MFRLLTGRANLPGSTRQRDLLLSFARMVPELWRNGNGAHLLPLVKNEDDLNAHRPTVVAPSAPEQPSTSSVSVQQHEERYAARGSKDYSRPDVALGSGKRKREAAEQQRKKNKQVVPKKNLWDEEEDDAFFAGGLQSTFASGNANTNATVTGCNNHTNDNDDDLLLNAGF